MKKQQKTHVITDITCFDAEAPIYKILFQDRATSLLKSIIDKISIDRYEHVNFRLPSILIAGKEGKQLIIRAFSNSMCNRFEYIQGNSLGMGGCTGSLYKNSDTETIYYISSADELSAYSVSLLHNFINQGHIKFHDHMKDKSVTISADNKLFVFGVNDAKKLCPDLQKAIEYHCYLQNNNTGEMEIIVEMRLKWSGVDHQKEVPAIIVRNGAGSISKCMRLLSVCYSIMRGDGRIKMTIKDVEIGISLNKPIERPVSVPVDNDVPF